MLDVGALAADRKCLVLPVVVAMFITSLWTTTIITTITITITTTQLPCYFDFVSHSGLLTHNLSHSEVLQKHAGLQRYGGAKGAKGIGARKISSLVDQVDIGNLGDPKIASSGIRHT